MAVVRRLIVGLAAGLLLGLALVGCGSTATRSPAERRLWTPNPPTGTDSRARRGSQGQAVRRHVHADDPEPPRPDGDRRLRHRRQLGGRDSRRGARAGSPTSRSIDPAAGLFQCLLGAGRRHCRSPPDLGPMTPSCVVVPALTAATDPLVHHIFTDWIDPLVDRATALSVAATTLAGASGSCFSVESNSAALAPPVDPGVYCYAEDGILTGARVGFGTLLLAGAVEAAPPSVAIPAPVVARPPLPTAAPPPPPPPIGLAPRRGVQRLRRKEGRPPYAFRAGGRPSYAPGAASTWRDAGRDPFPRFRPQGVTLNAPCGRRSSFSAATRPSDGRLLVAVLMCAAAEAQPVSDQTPPTARLAPRPVPAQHGLRGAVNVHATPSRLTPGR